MIAKIPTIIVTVKDKKYKMSRADFSFIRMLVLSSRDVSHEETSERLRKLLESSLKFSNKKSFSLKLEPLAVDTEGFEITSSVTKLSAWDKHYMSNLISCAAAQPDTIVILPSYITVTSPSLPPATKAPVRKPRKKAIKKVTKKTKDRPDAE